MKIIKVVIQESTIRCVELIIVLSIAFSHLLIHSIRILLYPETRELFNRLHSNFDIFSIVVSEITALAMLFYILLIRGRSIDSIGLQSNSKIYWLDNALVSILLTAAVYTLNFLIYGSFVNLYYLFTGQQFVLEIVDTSFAQGYFFLWLVFMIINPFFEELIVRGYLMSELNYLTKYKIIGILVSIILQTSYHLYQGWAAALYLSITFAVYSLYFAKYKKIMPIVLSHLYFDLTALFYYRFH